MGGVPREKLKRQWLEIKWVTGDWNQFIKMLRVNYKKVKN